MSWVGTAISADGNDSESIRPRWREFPQRVSKSGVRKSKILGRLQGPVFCDLCGYYYRDRRDEKILAFKKSPWSKVSHPTPNQYHNRVKQGRWTRPWHFFWLNWTSLSSKSYPPKVRLMASIRSKAPGAWDTPTIWARGDDTSSFFVPWSFPGIQGTKIFASSMRLSNFKVKIDLFIDRTSHIL